MARKFYIESNGQGAIEYSNEQPEGFTLISDVSELKILYIRLYQQREIDGVYYYENFRASLVMDIISLKYSNEEVFSLETHVRNLQGLLICGNWATAQNENQNLSVSGIYDASMKEEIQTVIDEYIFNHY